MDQYDRKILSLLQENARISLKEIADITGFSTSTCFRRLRELEANKAITGYSAMINPEQLGLSFEAIVFINLRITTPENIAAFEKALADSEFVIEAERLFGTPDYLVRVVAENISHYQRLQDGELGQLPNIERMTSTLVMKKIVSPKKIPLTQRLFAQ